MTIPGGEIQILAYCLSIGLGGRNRKPTDPSPVLLLVAEAHALNAPDFQDLKTPQYDGLMRPLNSLVHSQGLVPETLNDLWPRIASR